ncbi:rRNA-processing protein EBP2 [Entomophthora muscae]|uniref:rRNA-processing protein EBP2 n=1 Tax=Entomophthora muscae TaxID=34485 RepID=A0ACC2T4M9_9FUNG|nr:rRNA-processing protein EBP2 [Entomophthora muscae]
MGKNKSKGQKKAQEVSASEDKIDEIQTEIVEEELIPLEEIQDLSADEGGEEHFLDEDAVPVQKVTKNNQKGLLDALEEIRSKNIAWVDTLSITAFKPLEIQDIHNDIDRELAFYHQALAAAEEAQKKLKGLGVPFTRPDDYFAEMVKSDEHMNKVRQKILDETQSIKASENARKQRELKKFGKQVQVEKIKERHLQKRQELDKIKTLKRKIKGGVSTDDFKIDLDDDSTQAKRPKSAKPNGKRIAKDAKFGNGGKKRWAKSNTRESTRSAEDGFDARKNASKFSNGKGKGNKPTRPGKSRRHGSVRK